MAQTTEANDFDTAIANTRVASGIAHASSLALLSGEAVDDKALAHSMGHAYELLESALAAIERLHDNRVK